MKTFKLMAVFTAVAILFNSCGIAFYGAKQKVNVTSEPSGAKIFVNGEYTGQNTPAKIKVTRRVKDTPTSVKKKMSYTLKKDGYQDYKQVDDSKFNIGSFLATAIISGAIGIGIDAAAGVNRSYPKQVHAKLSPGSSSSNSGLLIDRSQEEVPTETTTTEEPKVVDNTSKKTPNTNGGNTNTVDPGTVTIIPPSTKDKENEPTLGVVIAPDNNEKTNAAATTASQVIFHENFDNNNFGWPEEETKKHVYKISDGNYQIDHTSLITDIVYHELKDLNFAKQNYSLEIKMKQVTENKSGPVGFYYPVTNDTGTSYSIFISPEESFYTINYTTHKGKMDKKEFASGTEKAILKNEYNVLRIEKVNNVVKYYVNDVVIHKMGAFVLDGNLIGFSENIKDGMAIDYIKIETGINAFTPSLKPEKELEQAAGNLIQIDNYREEAWEAIKASSITIGNAAAATTEQPAIVKTEASQAKKLKKSAENLAAKGLKYRRSSLYTLMINDPNRDYSAVIQNSFGDEKVPQKFNDHNIGPYYINSIAELKTQDKIIDKYLNESNVAKMLVSKWFLRDKEGKFNMKMIAERGMYDASAMDKVVANASERGSAMLADAGEELIGKTFVIVNDYKFTSKEEIAEKTNKGLNFIKDVSSLAGVDVSGITDLTSAAVTIAGKGYIIKSTSYLYRLVWDEEAAAIFYNNYWTDDNSFDPAKVEAFNKATNFKLKYVGVQSAWADVQSSVFTDKSEEDLVKMATVKATDKAIAKLERKFEEFRTMTPLHSVEPLAAKIGLKEGLEKGDKFEVLQQELTEEGKTVYKRVGVIKVNHKHIWDNTLTDEEIEALKAKGELPEEQYTTFTGSGKFYPGQLIKQIN